MSVATKIFLYTTILMSIAFNIGTSITIYFNHQNNFNNYIEQSTNEYYTKMYYIQNEFITIYSKGDELTQELVYSVLSGISNINPNNENKAIVDVSNNILYSNKDDVNLTYISNKYSSMYSISDDITIIVDGNILYTSAMFLVDLDSYIFIQSVDISSLIQQRNNQIIFSLILNIVLMLGTCIPLFLLAKYLTKPINNLINATNDITNGDYEIVIDEVGNDEIALLAKNFNIMSDNIQNNINKLEEYAQSRDDFVRNFSHELKTPLTSIIGYSEILFSKKCDYDTVLELSSYIFEEGNRLEKLSKQMILLMQVKQQEIVCKPCNIIKILQAVNLSLEPILNEKNATLLFNLDYDYNVICNKELIKTLIINLTLNGINSCEINPKVIINLVEIDSDNLKIEITDNGKGIEQSELKSILAPFYMIDKSRKGSSTGIGLSICDEIVKCHKTELVFQSNKNTNSYTNTTGMTVSFVLSRRCLDAK